MYLSRLSLNAANSQARNDLADAYEQHRTLMRLADAGAGKMLWRSEPRSPTELLVQTTNEPDFQVFLQEMPAYLLAHDTLPNRLLNGLESGDILNFRVRANPTVKRNGKRHGLQQHDDQLQWLGRTLTANGAKLMEAQVSETRRLVCGRKREGRPIVLQSVVFDGIVQVTNPDIFKICITGGIGHGRALGFGLITLAR